MSFNNDDNGLVDEEARKEGERVRTDLMRGIFGDRDLSSGNGRINRGAAVLAQNEILNKKKKEDEKAQSEAFKLAQKALEEHLKELGEELERLRKSLRDLDELEDLIKAGKFDRNNNRHQSLLRSTGLSADDVNSPDALTKTEERRKAFKERMKEAEREYKESEKLRDDIGKGKNPPPEILEKIQNKVTTLKGNRESILGIDKVIGERAQEVAIEALGYKKGTEKLVKNLVFENVEFTDSESELNFDSPKQSNTTSLAKTINGDAFNVASLSENFTRTSKSEYLEAKDEMTAKIELPSQGPVPKNG